MPDQSQWPARRAGSGRTALRLVLLLSGFSLIAMRSVADAQTDLQIRIEKLQGEVAQARSAAAGAVAVCPAPMRHAVSFSATDKPAPQAVSRAARLVDEAPAGVDACARMESADAKVLQALSR